MVLGYKNEIHESAAKKSSRASWFGTGCTTRKKTKSGFAKTSNCHNFWPGCQNSKYYIWFLGRKMASTNLMIQKVAESLGLVLVARHVNRPNLVLAKLQTAINFYLAVRIGHIVYGFGVEK